MLNTSMSTFDMLTCFRNEEFFIQNYFMTVNPFKGLSLIEIQPKQLHLLHKLTYQTFVTDIVTERQVGVSTTFAAHALWLATFKPNLTIVLMARTRREAKELRNMVKVGHDNMPEWLQEDRTTDNKYYTQFANGSRIHYMNSDPVNLRGASVDFMFLDSFDTYTPERQTELYEYSDRHFHRFLQVAIL